MDAQARSCWKQIRESIGLRGQTFQTWSVYRPSNRPFTAKANGEAILVESPSIKGIRSIYFKEFQCVFNLYHDYVNRVDGIRQHMRDNCGLNSSYIITLIHEICQK